MKKCKHIETNERPVYVIKKDGTRDAIQFQKICLSCGVVVKEWTCLNK